MNTRRVGQALPCIALIGLIAGTLDITAAFVHVFIATGAWNPTRILYGIASGVFGPSASDGGTLIAVCGLVFHYLIATGWTALYFFAYPVIARYSTQRVLNGLAYGVFIWLWMNLVIVPLSNVPAYQMKAKGVIIGMLILMFLVGLPISFLTDRCYARARRQAA